MRVYYPSSLHNLLITWSYNFTRQMKNVIRSDTHIMSTLKRGGVLRQKWDVIGHVFFIKENWICTITRHAGPNFNILLTRNLPSCSRVRQLNHPLMIPLHCLCAKSKYRKRGQFKCDVTWFCFCFDFVHMHGAVFVL